MVQLDFGTVGKKSTTETGKLQRVVAITRHGWLVAEPFAVVAVDVAAVDVSPERRTFLSPPRAAVQCSLRHEH